MTKLPKQKVHKFKAECCNTFLPVKANQKKCANCGHEKWGHIAGELSDRDKGRVDAINETLAFCRQHKKKLNDLDWGNMEAGRKKMTTGFSQGLSKVISELIVKRRAIADAVRLENSNRSK